MLNATDVPVAECTNQHNLVGFGPKFLWVFQGIPFNIVINIFGLTVNISYFLYFKCNLLLFIDVYACSLPHGSIDGIKVQESKIRFLHVSSGPYLRSSSSPMAVLVHAVSHVGVYNCV
ncbi:uncharacterized protein DEA37_0005079 [Paragonimus westermani]|uniref:Uncharacterized protein n=1 Tax=Paragonimus westermani TaxID=34504 RepID=A0A5J4NQI9_9TREM|nr:uncharacterized protein DEA37_0005079 [Paragonimus westermani]